MWWNMEQEVVEQRTRTVYKKCGDRKSILGSEVETRDRLLEDSKISTAYCVSTSKIDQCGAWWSNNPWTGETYRGGICIGTLMF